MAEVEEVDLDLGPGQLFIDQAGEAKRLRGLAGQVPSLRGEPQITSARVFVFGSAQTFRARSRRALVSIHSTERS